jgi:hypothetical protein
MSAHPAHYELRYGQSRKVLARVLPDDKYPTMWRIHWPDGEVSDMVNLSRARDAARALARRRYPELDQSKGWHWKSTESGVAAPPVRQNAGAVGERPSRRTRLYGGAA